MGTRVYLGKLPYDARERDVEKFFKGYGRLREVLMKDGFAFIEFDDHRDADDAVHELNGKDLLGERVYVEFAREQRGGRSRERFSGSGGGSGGGGHSSRNNRFEGRRYGPPRNTEHRVRVENLSSRVSWQDLKDFMRQAGEVTYADAHKRERNVGIVDFATYSDMKNAIDKLDSSDLQGRRIRLSEDKSRRGKRSRSRSRSRTRRSRTRSRSRGSSKSRSRSRSRSRSKSASNGNGKARSKSRSQSPMDVKDNRSKSRSRSRSRSVSKGRGDSRSPSVTKRSASPDRRSRSGSVRRSHSPGRDDSPRKSDRRSESRERSRSRSRSRSASGRDSRSRSVSPKDDHNGMDD